MSAPPPPPPSGQQGYGQQYGQPAYAQPPFGPSGYGQGAYGQPPGAFAPDGRPIAGFGRRFGAFVLDSLVLSLPVLVLYGVIVVLLIGSIGSANTNADGTSDPSPVSVVLLLGVYGLLFVYALGTFVLQAELVHRRGATLAMGWLGLRVVDAKTGGGVSRGKAYGRAAFAQFISGQICALGYFWSLWDPRKRTLHDLVCDTLVLSAP